MSARGEKKEIIGQLQFKDLKISDLTSSLQNSVHELNNLKKFVKSKPNENISDSNYKTQVKYENKLEEISQENEELKERIEIYESREDTTEVRGFEYLKDHSAAAF